MITDQKIIIVTHEMFYGVPHALRDYLINKKVEKIIFIGLPFMEQSKYSFSEYKNGVLILEKKINQRIGGIVGFVVDFLLTIYWVMRQKEKYDTLIAIDVLNALSALVLRKFGKIKKVIFYAVDFAPIRFQNQWLNLIYHKIEKLCVTSSDEVWDISPKIAEGRKRFLHIDPKTYYGKVVNSGIWIKKVKQFPFGKIKKHQLIFLGHILEKQGLQKVLESVPAIIRKIPDFKFLIFGDGEYEDNLRKLVQSLKIERYVEFKGWIKERQVIDITLGESAAAIVVYVPDKEKIYNFSYYGDPIKIKEYLASGLPVILTDVPHNAEELEKRKCGIIVRYQKEEIANAVIKLLSNEQVLREYRENAFKYAKEFDWNIIFSKALN